MLPQFFARRYLFSPKSRSVVNLISGLSVVAVAMPVAAMIILLSVFNGFESLVKSMYSAFDADLTVSARLGQTFPADAIDTAAVARIPGVEAFSFVLEQSALLEHAGRQATATVRGVDDAYAAVFPLDSVVSAGEYRVRLGDIERLVMGQSMTYMLGIRSLADADVNVYAVRRGSFSSLLPFDNYTRRTVPLGGVYSLDLETERTYVLASLRLAQELFSHPGRVSGLVVRLREGADAEQVRQALARLSGDDYRVRTRHELRASFYRIMTYEKWGIFFISLLVLVIASFSVVGALAMLIVDKRRDIVTLRALGADTSLVRAIFRSEGLLICGLGAACGALLGVGLSLLQQHFGLIEIPAETLLAKSYPVEFRPGDLLAVLVAFGRTKVICAVTIEEDVPRWMKVQRVEGGWLTAEYSMLPYSTLDRKRRDITAGKLDGRSSEIQRLIGRSLRAAVDLGKIGQRTIWVDCDVLQADGGTRTASITGASVALAIAVNKLVAQGKLAESPMKRLVSAVSVGMLGGEALLDLCYVEDKDAEVDMNLVMTDRGEFVEVQGSGEEAVFTADQMSRMLELGRKGLEEIAGLQRQVIADADKPDADALEGLSAFFGSGRQA